MKFKKKATTIGGKKIFYWQKNQHKKQAVILLHGFPGSHRGLVEMANGLKNYHLIIPDLPACGESQSFDAKHNLESYSVWLKSFLEHLSLDSVVIIGHSFGSRIGLVFSDHYPEKVNRLVLITPVVKVDGLVARLVAIDYGIARFLPQYMRKSWLSNRFYNGVAHKIIYESASPKRRQTLIARDAQELKRFNPQISIEMFDEFYKTNLIPLGERVKAVTLVIAGDKDLIAPLGSVRELASRLIGAEFIIMKNSGHIVVAEKPLTTAKIISRWLKQTFN